MEEKIYDDTFNEWQDIYDIEFMYNSPDYKSHTLQSIISFDIECSSGFRQKDGNVIGFDHELYNNDESYRDSVDNGLPVSIMYIWQMAIENGNDIKCFKGRTWEEFDEFLTMLTTEIRRQAIYGKETTGREYENSYAMRAKESVSMKIFVHNLSYEFSFLQNLYNKQFAGKGRGRNSKLGNVFARDKRKPIKARMSYNKTSIEFRCSYFLTNKSLKNWCEDEKLAIQKLEENEDFYLPVRVPTSKLSSEELAYSKNDVCCMILGIKKYRDKYGALGNIPLTSTGEIRLVLKERVAKANPEWAEKCYNITTSYTPQEMKRLVNMFAGGWTHANKTYVDELISEDNKEECYRGTIVSFDYSSSYPGVMTTMKFPLEKFVDCDVTEYDSLNSQDVIDPEYRWYMKVEIKNMRSKLENSYWSVSKFAYNEDNPVVGQVVDNGRIYSAERLVCYMTDFDWKTFVESYNFESFEVMELYKSKAGYLPNEMIEVILDAYQNKTSLKGLEDTDPTVESKYRASKALINAIYGVSCTKLISEIIGYDIEGWTSKAPDDEEFYNIIEQTNKETSFITYQIGVWVTAAARYRLFHDVIIPLDKHIIYCDTDSAKGLFDEDDIKYIESLNESIADLERLVSQRINIDPDMYTAKTSKGTIKRISVLDRESDSSAFKTLGAKRYCYKEKETGKIKTTIAGLPKKAGTEKIKDVNEFSSGLVWNTKESHKKIAYYNDNQPHTIWTDRDGNKYESDDKYGVAIYPTTFDLSMSDEFAHFINLLRLGRINRDDKFFASTPAWFFK